MADAVLNLFRVDDEQCVRCGACVRDCAFKALKASDDGRPLMAHPERCMRCQHCLAICPAGAVSLDGKTAGDCLDAKDAELPSPKAVENWMALRRSVRSFRSEDVDPAVLDRILKALGNSPTGCNARSLTLTCFRTRAAMDALRKRFIEVVAAPRKKMLPRWLAVPAINLRKGDSDMFFRGATGMLVVSSDASNKEVVTPREDVTIACSNFELLANANGIATCWCGFMGLVQQEVPNLMEELAGVPGGHPYEVMLFGLPAVSYPRGVARTDYARIVYRDASV